MNIFAAIDTQDVKQVLEALKADPDCIEECDNSGMTPLMHAAIVLRGNSCDPIVQALVNAMKAKDMDVNGGHYTSGRTALHWAAYSNNTTFISALQKHAGANIHYYVRDNSDLMAHQLAETKGYVAVMEVIAPERFKARVGSGPVTLAVIGVGPAGAGMFIRLVRGLLESNAVFKAEQLKQIKILLIDEKAVLGSGTPYSAEKNSDTSCLNIPASTMSVDALNANDFVEYIKSLYSSGTLAMELGVPGANDLRPASVEAKGYYPRLFYGKYINARLAEWTAKARAAGIDVVEMPNTSVVDYGTIDDKGLTLDVRIGKDAKKIHVTHAYQATGHWPEESRGEPYEKASGTFIYPANREKLVAQKVFAEPGNLAIMGSALSAIDVVFAVLLDPDVGTLTWQGDEPTYVPIKKGFKVTAYSRRGVWPRVRPLDNVDKNPLKYCSPETYQMINAWRKKPPTLQEGIELLGLELDEAYGKPHGTFKPLLLADPLGNLEKGKLRDPFELLMRDVKLAEDGDGTTAGRNFALWYQVIHALYPVMDMFYRGLTPKEREEFESKVNTPFLWAFAPMPHRSARVLNAMHKAKVLDLHRIDGFPETKDNKNIIINYFDYDGTTKKTEVHPHMAVTIGLASKFYNDLSPLTKNMMKKNQITFKDPKQAAQVQEGSIFVADDGSFEVLDAKGNHSPAHRAMGFFLQSQYWAIGAAPSVVRFGRQAAELYLGEFAARFNGVLNTFPRQPKPAAKL